MRKDKDTTEPENSRLHKKGKQKKETRYAAECWYSFSYLKENSFWYEFGSSNQLDEIYSLIDKQIRGSGTGGYGLLKLTESTAQRTIRIVDRKDNKIQMVVAFKDGNDYHVSKREWTDFR